MPETKTKKIKNSFKLPSVQELIDAGVHLGHKKSKWNPKMENFILKQKGGLHIIDVEKTIEGLERALKFIQETIENGHEIIFVSTKPPFKKLVQETAERLGQPYVSERWLGGSLTNFKNIFKRVELFRQYQEKKEKDELGKYTKKERTQMEKEMNRLGKKLSGLTKMRKMPSALFIVGLKEAKVALDEAITLNLPVIAFCDTDADPSKISYPIPSSDDSLTAIGLIMDKVAEAVEGIQKKQSV